MISLTRKTEYALIALSHLGRSPDTLSTARGISDAYDISLPLLMNIMKQLTKAGLVESVRGARGGYRLAVQADEVSLQELIRVVEGPIRLVKCAVLADRPNCVRISLCPVRSSALRIHRRLEQFLSDVSLAELIGGTGLDAPEAGELVEEEVNAPRVS